MELKYLNSFNEEQKELTKSNKNKLVIAGAGSGKTRSLIGLVEKALFIDNLRAEQIILSTYTTKAADEIKERLEDAGISTEKMFVGTIHSIARRIIVETDRIKSKLTVLDEDDILVIFASYCDDKNLLFKLLKVYSDKKEIYRHKTLKELIMARDISVDKEETILKIFEKYETVKRNTQSCDFSDLMVDCLHLINCKKLSIVNFLKNIRLIIVDEVQDINEIQYELFVGLNKYCQNMVMFGDDYQAIYGFRGSNSRLMKRFRENPNVETSFLKSNYRSTDHIVKFCNQIIERNSGPCSDLIMKECISVNDQKSSRKDVTVINFDNESQQYDYIVDILQKTQKSSLTKKIGILSRGNKELKAFSDFLSTQNINHVCQQNNKVQNSFKISLEKVFLDKENKNPLSCYYWWQIFTHYKAFDDKHTRKQIAFHSGSVWDLILEDKIPDYASNSQGQSRKAFLDDMKKLYNDYNHIYAICTEVASEKNVDSDSDSELDNRITLQTIHSSKGLEYDVLIVLDCKYRQMDSYEESVRLFYVACSRARSKLYITNIGSNLPYIEKIDKKLFQKK